MAQDRNTEQTMTNWTKRMIVETGAICTALWHFFMNSDWQIGQCRGWGTSAAGDFMSVNAWKTGRKLYCEIVGVDVCECEGGREGGGESDIWDFALTGQQLEPPDYNEKSCRVHNSQMML